MRYLIKVLCKWIISPKIITETYNRFQEGTKFFQPVYCSLCTSNLIISQRTGRGTCHVLITTTG